MKGSYFWKEWEGPLPPYLIKCGSCGMELTDEEYKSLPKVSLSSGEYLHRCRNCDYLFEVETWKIDSLAKVKVTEDEFEIKIHTQFLKAAYQGYCYQTRVQSFRIPQRGKAPGGYVSSVFMVPARMKNKWIRNHDWVCRMLRSGYFTINPPDFIHPLMAVRLKYVGKRWVPSYAVVEQSKQPKCTKPKGPYLFKILQNLEAIYNTAETPDQLVNKITELFFSRAIKPGLIIAGPRGPISSLLYVYHEDGHFTVTTSHLEGRR